MNELLDVVAVIARPDYKLLIAFEGGQRRGFDMRPLLDKPPFAGLKDPAEFARTFVDPALGTVCWPGGIEIAREMLWDRSVPATRETMRYVLDDLHHGDATGARLTEVDWGPDVGLERVDPVPDEDEDEGER